MDLRTFADCRTDIAAVLLTRLQQSYILSSCEWKLQRVQRTRTPSKQFAKREGLIEEHCSGEASENRDQERQCRRIGQRQVLQGKIQSRYTKESMTTSQCICKRWRMSLEIFLPGEASEHQQSPNTLGTKQWVWNVLAVPDNI